MKKIILLSLLSSFTVSSFGQQSAPKVHWTGTEYYKKSRKQKTAGWIFTVVGSAVLITTLIKDVVTSAIIGFQETERGIPRAYAIGGACVATGVVFFVASGNNKKKAKVVSSFFKMEKAPILQQTMINNKSFPAAGMRISL